MSKSSLNIKTFSVFIAIIAFSLSTWGNYSYAQQGGNADGTYTGSTGIGDTTNPGGNCGNGPHTHAGNAMCPNKPGGGTSVPLDGGLSFLVAVAAIFGIKKLREKK